MQNLLCVQVLRSPILAVVTARHSSNGHQPKFVALRRGRHLYSAGQPSRWVLAHILVLWPPCLIGQAIIFLPCGFFFLSLSFFFAYSQQSQVGWLPYIHTWCGLSANLRCRSETCCTRLAENTGRKNRQKIAIWAPWHNFIGQYLRTYGQWEKLVKQQYLLHMSLQYGKLLLTNG